MMDKDGDQYQVSLENLFEGPMDLLVFLIKKNEIDIYDIPIAFITDQYLRYLDVLKALNVDLAGDFLLMAATLTQIKSSMLLPVHDAENEAEEDPRNAIVRPLEAYLQMKTAAERLGSRHLLGEHTFARDIVMTPFVEDKGDEVIKVGLFELIDAFQRILDTFSADQRIELVADTISVKEKIAEIVDLLEKNNTVTFDELFDRHAGRQEIIVIFLAILEMVKLQIVRLVQNVQNGVIRLFYQ